jgi:endoglucanase
VAGKNTGTCAFKSTTVKETESQITGVLKSGCTYESSNPGVVAVDGSNLIVKSAGYSILTGNDGSQSFVGIAAVPKQTIPNYQDVTCSYSGDCNVTGQRALLFSGGTNKEYLLTNETKTQEGATFTLTSLNPEIVTVKKATCTNSACYGQKGQQMTMFEFKGFGTAKIVATAAAVTGYSALNDTISVTFKKGLNKMTNNFKNTTLKFGETAPKLVPDTTMYHTKVTYTFNDKETSAYVTKSGNGLTAGNENAVVIVTAHAPEVDNYQETNASITVIVGDSSKAVNKAEYQNVPIIQTRPELPLQAIVAGNMLSVNSNQPGEIEVEVFSVTGQNVLNKTLSKNYGALSLANIPNGAYLITIRQGIKQLNVKWNKK